MPFRPAATPSGAFNRLAWSNLAAQSAEQIGLAAAPMVAVLWFGAGAGQTGALQAAQTLPFLLLSAPAGVLADRASRRRLMASCEAARAVSLAGVLVLAALHRLTLPALAALGFVGTAGTVAYTVAAPSLVPAFRPQAALADANGRLELARSAAFAAGPALGGLLVGWTGGALAFAAAGMLSAVAAILLAGLPEPPKPALPRRHFLDDLREGGSFVFAHALLRPVLLTAVAFNIAFFTMQAVYVPYAVRALRLSPSGVGATLGAYGAGMVLGAALAPRAARRLPFGVVVTAGPVCGLAAASVMVATIWAPWPPLAGLSFFLIGAGPILWAISTTTLRQTVTPPELLGRVSAVVATATYGARPIGAAIGAAVGGALGADAALAVAAGGFAVQLLVILASPVPRLARLPGAEAAARPHRPWEVPRSPQTSG